MADSLWTPESTSWTWWEIVDCALSHLDGEASLRDLYEVIEKHPKTVGKQHWKAKVRQVLEQSSEYVRIDKGVWAMRHRYEDDELKQFDELRREVYPLRQAPKES